MQVLLQFGSLGILGYFLLVVQPEGARNDRTARMDEIRLLVSIFSGERDSFEERVAPIEAELRRLRETSICKIDMPKGGWFRTDVPPPPKNPPAPGQTS